MAEVELEEDGMVSLEALKCHFGPLVVSMKYQNETTGLDRYVRVTENHFLPPEMDGEGGHTRRSHKKNGKGASDHPTVFINTH